MHIVIIGSGSAAFAAAIQASGEGANVTIVEKGTIGGTCVNVGCVPSKILIRAAEAAHMQSSHPFNGLKKMPVILDRRALTMQQEARVDELRHAKYEKILEENDKIQLIKGEASFKDPQTVVVKTDSGKNEELIADRVLIATGSHSLIPDIDGLIDTPYWTSTEALQIDAQPKSLAVIGGSVVALELAQAYARLGTKVTVFARSTLLSKEDDAIGSVLKGALEEEGLTILTHTLPEEVSHNEAEFSLRLADGTQLTFDHLLIASGRKANTSKLNLEAVSVNTDKQGRIVIDDEMRTSNSTIFAAGDCTDKPQFVYVAAAAGSRAAVNMMGRHAKLDLTIMPTVVFTDPQVATVGLTEEQALAQGIDAESRLLTLDNVPRALSAFDTRGFVKLVAEKGTRKIVGAQILAHEGGEIIQTVAVAMKAKMTINDLSQMLFPYLTMAEAIKLCAQTFTKNVKELSCCADTVILEEEVEDDCCASNKSGLSQELADNVKINSTSHQSYFSVVKQNPITSLLVGLGVFAVTTLGLKLKSINDSSSFTPKI